MSKAMRRRRAVVQSSPEAVVEAVAASMNAPAETVAVDDVAVEDLVEPVTELEPVTEPVVEPAPVADPVVSDPVVTSEALPKRKKR
jgi:hypothetical protein